MQNSPRIVILMGVAGSGKSTVGQLLAAKLGVGFLDGDDMHPEANVAKMSAGSPLTDEDRWPWLQAIGERLATDASTKGCAIGGCSALRRRYRDRLAEAAGQAIRFVHLNGAMELIAERMSARRGHFMPLALLQSQFETLEPLEQDEAAFVLDIGPPPEELVERILGLDPLLARP